MALAGGTLLSGALVAVGALLPACIQPGAPQVQAHSLVLPLDGPCPATGDQGIDFSREVTTLRLTLAGPDIPTPLAVEGNVGGALTLDAVPAGANRTVALFGRSSAGATVWRGVSPGINVAADADTPVDVLMARLGDLTCGRTGDAQGRAFHTATPLLDGRILIVGGARLVEDIAASCGAGCRRITAGGSAVLFHPDDGTFTPVANLTVERMFHTATLLADGRVVIAGGTREAIVRPADATAPFPIVPTLPTNTIEVFDPTSNSFASAGTDPAGPRVFAASVTLPSGEVLISGGIPAGDPVRNDLHNAMASTTICGGTALACRPGPSMAKPRAGHIMFHLDAYRAFPGAVQVWGGSIDISEPPTGLPGYQHERWLDDGTGFALVDVAAMSSARRNLFFPAVAQYVNYRVLAAGGLVRDADGTFRLATTQSGDLIRGAAYVYDASGDGDGLISTGVPGQTPIGLDTPTFLGAGAVLPGQTRALIAGGFSSLALAPVDQLSLYDEGSQAPTIGSIPAPTGRRVLRQARGGLTAVTTEGGNVVLAGGLSPDGSVGTTAVTAEVFADPLLPPGVAP